MMRVGELLSELRSNLLRDKSDQVAGSASDQLWTDDTLIRYIAQAQTKFASLTSCIRDGSTPEVCQVALTAGKRSFPLHPKVVAVMSARYPGDHADLARAGHAAFDTYTQPDNRWFDANYLSTLIPGKPRAFSTDEGVSEDDDGSFNAIQLRVFPDVGVGYDATLSLRVIRLPLLDLTKDRLEQRLEVPEQYHMDLLDWAAYLALRAPDLDVAGGDGAGRARELKTSFMASVAECKRDMQRRMFAPMTWGFGRHGFSYERD